MKMRGFSFQQQERGNHSYPSSFALRLLVLVVTREQLRPQEAREDGVCKIVDASASFFNLKRGSVLVFDVSGNEKSS